MSDTFQYIAKRAAGQRQITRKSQFSKEVFTGRNAASCKKTAEVCRKDMIIVC
ncbi:MAG: hypothetical protein PHP13_03325 [Methanomicrobium sp.]|nr:hypothetical protein [Methanomicrobium sp.]MDD4299320.1 hypothetical protein [Methanomicrobium sp.]